MVLGVVDEVINATKVHLEFVSGGQNRLVMLQELSLVVDHPENREAADVGSVYFYGQSDDAFDATILLTTPEINTFHGWTILTASGDLPEQAMDLILTSFDGTNKTYNVQVKVPRMEIDKPIEGGTKTRLRFRIVGGTVSAGTSIQASDIVSS